MAKGSQSDKIKNTPKANSSMKKTEKKKSKYDEKIVVDASFEELMKELITPKKK